MNISKLLLFLTFILSVLFADSKVISSPQDVQAAQPKQSKSPSAPMKPTGRKPNVIIILADDLGCGDMCLYDGWINTPRIDQMAREGVRFTDFHSNSSVCSPTRIAFMTGRYQQRIGIVDVIVGTRDKEGLESSEVTISGLLKNAGYKTALFGKWHCGTDLRHNPTNHGFDEFVGFLTGAGDYHKHRNWYDGTQVKEQKGYSTHIIADQYPERTQQMKAAIEKWKLDVTPKTTSQQ